MADPPVLEIGDNLSAAIMLVAFFVVMAVLFWRGR